MMYLGGMGGTGKTQVLKAIMSLMEKRNEGHRVMKLAPTGSAAALLGGSTYHSILGIRDSVDGGNVSKQTLTNVKSRLEGVDYIFLNEVSMVSCQNMYKLSSRLAQALNEPDLPFGGMSMIFAGDLAQLPPVPGGEGTSLYKKRCSISASTKLWGQESAIGQALWHQITTVVILRQNMRQRGQSESNKSL